MTRSLPSRMSVMFAAAFYGAALSSVVAEPAHRLVAEGNDAYAAGDYEKALTLYEEASVEVPESAQVYFNRGAVRYRQEDYERAKDAFREAALRSKEPGLNARAKYNLGNCAFRQAERQRDSDLAKAIEHCREAISFYQEAHDLDPDFRKAAENIEIVRLYVKVLLDEQQKKQEQQQQQQGDDLVQKLLELIERQGEQISENERLAEAKPDPAAAEPGRAERWQEELEALGSEQGVLRDDTQAVHEEIEQRRSAIEQAAAQAQQQGQDPNQAQPPGQPQGQPQPSPEQLAAQAEKLQQAGGHVTNAIASQQAAIAQLAAAAQQTAVKNQEAAVTSLEDAVKALADPNQQQQQQQGSEQQQDQQDQQEGEQQEQQQEQDQQDDEEENSEQQQSQEQEGQAEQKDEESEEEKQARARLERAEDILDEEKKRQRPVRPLRGVPVDRDW